ncbi:MAG: aminomethyl transferase family protein [Candidatus Cloacimonadia bacterium]
MTKIGFDFPQEPRKTALYEVEDWYQNFLAEKLNKPYEPIKRSNFGQYAMAVNYLTSVIEEAKAVERVAIFNIDHMAQLLVTGEDSIALLQRTLPADIDKIKIGQCKYTLLLNDDGNVLDDMIIMRVKEKEFILVINAGHDITDKVVVDGKEIEYVADADYIMGFKKDGEDVKIEDISDKYVKIDAQGPYAYKLITQLYGKEALANRNNPSKNMTFFSFNEFEYKGETCYFSRTGYTNRWGWEMYLPASYAVEEFKRIVTTAYEFGGLLVGLGGRDENRISAGNFGLPLNGSEYDVFHTPTNAPLFNAAVDIDKPEFVGQKGLLADIEAKNDKKLVLFITEGIVTGRGIYRDGIRIGIVTSSINSPNVSFEKRLFIESKRKGVNEENGIAAIGLGWLYENPFEVDAEGNDILEKDGAPIRIPVEFYREKEGKEKTGTPVKGFISGDGVNPATSHRGLKPVESL